MNIILLCIPKLILKKKTVKILVYKACKISFKEFELQCTSMEGLISMTTNGDQFVMMVLIQWMLTLPTERLNKASL